MTDSLLDTLLWLALNIYHEARGETVEGQKAVAKVVLNRAIERGQTVEEVVMADAQFSWTEDGYPDYPKDYRIFFYCAKIALDAVIEFTNGKTLKGANHYFNHNLVSPSWMKGMEVVKIIGNHTFLKG